MAFIKKVLLIFVCFTSFSLSASTFTEVIHSKVLETIESAETIPGLKPEEFVPLKRQITRIWSSLIKEECFDACYTDKELRPYFVALQGIVESTLAKELRQEIRSLKCITLAPMPEMLLTDYLLKGGDLFVAYPKEGFNQRTEAQQKTYRKELRARQSHLSDVPLECESIPSDLVGATYFFEDQEGKMYVFAIKMTLDTNLQGPGFFALWFGSIDSPCIRKRVSAVSSYLEEGGANILNLEEESSTEDDSNPV